MANLTYRFENVIHAVDVSLGKVTARGINRNLGTPPDCPARGECTSFTFLTETVVLKLKQDGNGEAIVELSDVDIIGSKPSSTK